MLFYPQLSTTDSIVLPDLKKMHNPSLFINNGTDFTKIMFPLNRKNPF
jgi:hypothetical protein